VGCQASRLPASLLAEESLVVFANLLNFGGILSFKAAIGPAESPHTNRDIRL
jgi:hypothetical protein